MLLNAIATDGIIPAKKPSKAFFCIVI